jgi:ribosome-associated protein
MIRVTEAIAIDEADVHVKFVRASGPGGQNVNKVATAAQLRFDVAGNAALPTEVKQRLIRLAGSRMTIEGVLILDARRFRSQEQNRQDAIDRLVALLRRAATPPKPRRRTRPSLASKRRRLESKRRRGQTKEARRRPGREGQ